MFKRLKRYQANMGTLWTAVNLGAFAAVLYYITRLVLLLPGPVSFVLLGTQVLCLVLPVALLNLMVRHLALTFRIMRVAQIVLLVLAIYHFTGSSGLPLWASIVMVHLICLFIGVNLCVLSDPRVLTEDGLRAVMKERARRGHTEHAGEASHGEAEALVDDGFDSEYAEGEPAPEEGAWEDHETPAPRRDDARSRG